MSIVLNRRSFLHASTGLGLGLAVSGPLSAIEPIKRNGTPSFKFSLAAYSYRNLLQGGKLTLADFIDDCARFGLEGTELTSYYFPSSVTPEYLHSLRHQAFQLGLDVSGTAVGNDFCHAPGAKRDEQIALVRRWVDYSALMDAPVIRIFSGNVKKGMTVSKAHALAVEGMQECCEYAGKQGVHLALENHGGLTANVNGMLALVHDVDSPWFGVNMDTGNFHSDDIYGDLAKIAPYSLNVQVKVFVSNSAGRKPSDFKRLAQILRDSAYRGYIVLEYEEREDPREHCPKYLDQLRDAFA